MSLSIPYTYTSLGYQQLTAGTASPGTVLSLPSGIPVKRSIMVPSGPVRWLDTGGTPTASSGMPIASTQPFTFDGDHTKFRVIGNGAAATIDIMYYG